MATQTKPKNKGEQSARRAPKELANGQTVRPKTATIRPKNLEVLRVLRAWDNFTPEEIEEQKETWAFLKKALDEDRLSPNRPHFPADEDEAQ